MFLDYETAEKEMQSVIDGSSNVLEDVVDFLYKNFDYYSWVGIYTVENNELVLGPWRGPHATEHTRIPIGSGICGAAASSGKTEIVPDVKSDGRYLSCFVSTKSEIVVPIKKQDMVVGEIDIDSDKRDAFTKMDSLFLEKVSDMLGEHIH
jgi:GAF domain-containing protein